ncbi:hypothetical protein LWI29_014146 [Acer saccharum]|uniref:Uncharacterized protein n=1 Tax=Acer saccharum TaxID=4024 RepID=A0AA39SSI4_ACESA|nr:hypothetical protein LWI29_014146 [Acer saccharum]
MCALWSLDGVDIRWLGHLDDVGQVDIKVGIEIGRFGGSSAKSSGSPGGSDGQWRSPVDRDGGGELDKSSGVINNTHVMEGPTDCSIGVFSGGTSTTTDILSVGPEGGQVIKDKLTVSGVFMDEVPEPMHPDDSIPRGLHGKLQVNDVVSKVSWVKAVGDNPLTIVVNKLANCAGIFQRWNTLGKKSAARCVAEKKKELADCREFKRGLKKDLSFLATLWELNNREDGITSSDPTLAKVQAVLDEYKDIMPKELLKKLPPRREVDHQIELELGAKPLTMAPYRMAPPELEELRK